MGTYTNDTTQPDRLPTHPAAAGYLGDEPFGFRIIDAAQLVLVIEVLDALRCSRRAKSSPSVVRQTRARPSITNAHAHAAPECSRPRHSRRRVIGEVGDSLLGNHDQARQAAMLVERYNHSRYHHPSVWRHGLVPQPLLAPSVERQINPGRGTVHADASDVSRKKRSISRLASGPRGSV